ncbi:MAG: methyltransferase domain-containing protein, partial [Candidatus Omnitrophica bacterium]|nr:methyltransferase domain-containing protein [Candidatus Omnitrophota bacterium]
MDRLRQPSRISVGRKRSLMEQATFDEFRRIVHQSGGISLRENKKALVESRVSKRMRALGYENAEQYLKFLKNGGNSEEMVFFLDCMTTNLTYFFREPQHFDYLRVLFRDWIQEGRDRIRLWSAACSTGEEPYSMAMVTAEAARGLNLDARILATDLSTEVLERAKNGVYDSKKIEPVPDPLAKRYLERFDEGFRVKDSLKKFILFKRLNLSIQTFPMKGPFDAIFCRNVMIYFDNNVRSTLLMEIYRLLRPGGVLMVGQTESLTGLKHPF